MKWSSICAENEDIIAVIVFGSAGRGDIDDKSDFDLFILTDGTSVNELCLSRDEIASILSCDPLSILMYTEPQFHKLLICGSLFAWHLKLEGQVVYTRKNIEELFIDIIQYTSHYSDIICYSGLLSDCRKSLFDNDVNAYDLAQMFTVARNCCIVISHKLNCPAFGRLSAYTVCRNLIGDNIVLSEADYLLLCSWKMSYGRGIFANMPLPTFAVVENILKDIQTMLDFGIELCKNY